MALKLIVPPAELPVTLDQVKSAARVDSDEQDALLVDYLHAAVSQLDGAEGLLGRCLMEQTWQYTLDAFPGRYTTIKLPLPPLISVEQIEYVDAAGVEQVLPSSQYAVFRGAGMIMPVATAYWPTTRAEPDAVRITYKAGYGENGDWNHVPEALRAAITMMAVAMYDGLPSGEAWQMAQQFRVLPV